MSKIGSRVLLVAGTLAASACAAIDQPPSSQQASACDPGVTVTCGCIDGTDGTQTCEGDGSQYGACDCGGGIADGGRSDARAGDGSTQADSAPGPCTGTMVNGRCLTTLATAQLGVAAIAVNGTDVFWTNGTANTVSKCSANSCATPTPIASGQTNPFSIVADATDVYWTTTAGAGAIMKCAVGGCAQPTPIVNVQSTPFGIALDATNVYWSTTAGVIGKCAKSACLPTVLASTQGFAGSVAVDATSIYWPDNTAGSMFSCAIGGCGMAPKTLVSGIGQVFSIAINPTAVFWTIPTGVGSVSSCPLGGCAVGTPLATNQAGALGIVADATNVYFRTNDSLMRCAVGGCGGQPTALVTGLGTQMLSANDVAIDAASVYFTDSASGRVMKLSPR